MTGACAPLTIPLHTPWLFRWADQLWARAQAWRGAPAAAEAAELYVPDLEVLQQLSLRTLQDIGAPDWVQARVAADRAAEQERLQRWLSLSPRHDTHFW